MLTRKFLCIFLSFLLTSQFSYAQIERRQDRPEDMTFDSIEVPRYMYLDRQTYDVSLPGARELIDSLREKNSDTYQAMNQELQGMESKRKLGIYLGWGLIVGGLTLAILSSGPLAKDSINPVTSLPETETNVATMIIGLLGVAGGTSVLFLVPPSTSDIYRFMKKNDKRPGLKNLRWNFGVIQKKESLLLGFRTSF